MIYFGHGYMMDGWGGDGGGNAWGWLFMTFWLIILVLVVIFVVRYLNRGGHFTNHKDAVAMLKKRYAAGEIDKKEYQEKLKDLKT